MASTVKSRPNHYEVLGLAPDASDEEIARAFAREMSPLRPRPVGGLAQLSLAYETLRDPARRRAYDASLAPAPAPEPKPTNWSMPRRDGWPFVASARIGSADLPAIDSLPRAAREADRKPRQEPVAKRRPEPFVAAPPRQRPEPPRPRPEVQAKPAPAVQADENRAFRIPPQQPFLDAEDSAGEWKRPAMIGGTLFLSVAFLGAWLGVESANDIDEAQPQKAVTLSAAKAKAAPPDAEAPPPEPRSAAKPSAEPQARAVAEARAAPPPRPAPAEQPKQQLAEARQPEQNRIEDIASSLAVEEEATTAAAETPAKLPLPDSVVARTIRRIGYSCGEVASTAPVGGGAAGVFKVTCTSGQTYRAAPIGGRYHFRRWGRQ